MIRRRRDGGALTHALVLAVALLMPTTSELIAQEIWPAETEEQDYLFLRGQLLRISPDGDGGEGGIDWVHRFSPRLSLQTGIAHYTLEDVRWTYGKLGGTYRFTGKTAVHGEVHRGDGSEQSLGFGYRVYSAGVVQNLIEGRLAMQIEDQYLEIHQAYGNIVKVGMTLASRARASADFAYHTSTSGNIDTNSFSARLRFRPRKLAYLGGAVVGRSTPEGIDPAGAPVTIASSELFAGVEIPIGSAALTVLLDSIDVADSRRNALVVSLKLAI